MVLDVVVRLRLELVSVKVLHNAPLQPRAYGLLASWPTREYLHVYDVMFLSSCLRVVVLAAVEYEVAGTHLIER